jgi:hypothetical protein
MATIAYNTPGIEGLLEANPRSFKVEVLGVGESTFVTNGLRFSTPDGAAEWALDLADRWSGLAAWRINVSDDEPTRD